MKKTIVYIISIVIVICVLITSKLYTSKEYMVEIKKPDLCPAAGKELWK